jgi:hypothetical protein
MPAAAVSEALMWDVVGWVLAAGSTIAIVIAVIYLARRKSASPAVTIALAIGLVLLAFATRALLFPASDWWIAAAVGVAAAALVIVGVRRALREPGP